MSAIQSFPSNACVIPRAKPEGSMGPSRHVDLRAIERLVAFHGHAIAQPLVREVVPHRMMLGRTVVPESDRVRTPGEAALELRRLAMTIEHLEQRIAFAAAQADDVGGEVAVHIERLAARHRMR